MERFPELDVFNDREKTLILEDSAIMIFRFLSSKLEYQKEKQNLK